MVPMRTRFVALVTVVLALVAVPFAGAADSGDIKLTFLGTGAPRPSHERDDPATLVEAGDHKIMIDASPGKFA